jgi:serine/threonine protein kinase
MMQGGIGIKQTDGFAHYTREYSIWYFMTNATFKIFTNTSLNAITFLVTLNAKAPSPFYSLDASSYSNDITQILLKVSITNKKIPQDPLLPIIGRENDGINLTSLASFKKEVDLQEMVYFKSCTEEEYNSGLQGICPSIITSETLKVGDGSGLDNAAFYKLVLENIVGRKEEVQQVLQYGLTNGNSFSFIAMELLQGYTTVYEATIKGAFRERHEQIMNYAFYQLHRMGIVHNDPHQNNVMINPNENYFSTQRTGRIMIIDFGLAEVRKMDENVLALTNKAIEANMMNLEPIEKWYYADPDWPRLTVGIYKTMTEERQRRSAKIFEESVYRTLPPDVKKQMPIPPLLSVYDFIMDYLLENNKREQYFTIPMKQKTPGLKSKSPRSRKSQGSLHSSSNSTSASKKRGGHYQKVNMRGQARYRTQKRGGEETKKKQPNYFPLDFNNDLTHEPTIFTHNATTTYFPDTFDTFYQNKNSNRTNELEKKKRKEAEQAEADRREDARNLELYNFQEKHNIIAPPPGYSNKDVNLKTNVNPNKNNVGDYFLTNSGYTDILNQGPHSKRETEYYFGGRKRFKGVSSTRRRSAAVKSK